MTNSSKYRRLPSDALIKLFAEASIARSTAIRGGKAWIGNKHYDAMTDIHSELKARSLEAQRLLLPLLNHVEPSVCCDAAMYVLEFAPSQAEPVLRSLQSAPGVVGYEAGLALRMWQKRELF
jgi:hypothetical protein